MVKTIINHPFGNGKHTTNQKMVIKRGMVVMTLFYHDHLGKPFIVDFPMQNCHVQWRTVKLESTTFGKSSINRCYKYTISGHGW